MKWHFAIVPAIIFMLPLVRTEHRLGYSFYRIALVSYHPNTYGTIGHMVTSNANKYIGMIKTAKRKSADIIVFPEHGLLNKSMMSFDSEEAYRLFYMQASTHLADFESKIMCIDEDSMYPHWARKLSCSARNNKIYVAVNLYERVECYTKKCCPPDGNVYYNTNVLFDPHGRVVNRYRKQNVFSEPGLNTTTKSVIHKPIIYGIQFALIHSHDLYNQDFTHDRLADSNDIIYMTSLHPNAPFMTVADEMSAWSYVTKLNFLLSGYNDNTVSIGSGVFSTKCGLYSNYSIPRDSNHRLVLASVPKIDRKCYDLNDGYEKTRILTFLSNQEGDFAGPKKIYNRFSVMQRLPENRLDYNGVFLNLELNRFFDQTLDAFKLRCIFSLESEYIFTPETHHYRYWIFAINTHKHFGDNTKIPTTLCGIVACAHDNRVHDDPTNCGVPIEAVNEGSFNYTNAFIFKWINITMISTTRFTAPVTSKLYPWLKESEEDIHFSKIGSSVYNLYLKNPKNVLFDYRVLGIYGWGFTEYSPVSSGRVKRSAASPSPGLPRCRMFDTFDYVSIQTIIYGLIVFVGIVLHIYIRKQDSC